MKRREHLLGTSAVVTGLAGCSALSSSSSRLDLTVFSHSDTPYTIEISFFENGTDMSRSEARMYDDRIDVEPQGKAQREDIVEAQPCLVSYHVYEDNRKLTDEDHVHYYPADDGDDGSLAFDIDSSGALTRR